MATTIPSAELVPITPVFTNTEWSPTPGPLLTRLHALTSVDCTTRNKAKAQRLAAASDGLEARIAELAALEELDNIRPELNGD